MSITPQITVFVVGVTGYIIYYLYKKTLYKDVIKRKQARLEKMKEDLHNKLEELNTPLATIEDITSKNLENLSNAIESGTYKSIDVLHAFQAKALLMDKQYNFIVDLNPNAEIDLIESCKLNNKGPLKGIPISVKDVFYVKDCDCTYGMPSLCFQPSIRDSAIVKSLRIQGAIPFVVTNMCQTGISIESSNIIFGETVNPHNKERTCGGSSGGEGAILASGASILGLGSDVGGSIRIPASYCGIFGIKPTSSRFTRRYTNPLFPDQNLINVSIGPMARRFNDLLTFFRVLTLGDSCHLDPYCPPLRFRDDIYSNMRPLKIGYYTHMGESQVTPVPAVVRAVIMAKNALESAGHTLVEFNLPNVDKAVFELYMNCMFTDGGRGFIDKFIKNNPVDSSLSLTTNLLRLPNFLKKILSYVLYPFNKNYSSGVYSLAGVNSVFSLWELKDKLDAYKEDVLTKWQMENLDGVICPVLPITAPPCQTSKYVMDIIGYTSIYNVLDYPAGSVPVTVVNQNDIDSLMKSYPRDTPTHRQIINLQKGSIGMPVGVQCVTLPWSEELCLKIMGEVDSNLA